LPTDPIASTISRTPPAVQLETPDSGITSYAQQFELSVQPSNAVLQRLMQNSKADNLYAQISAPPDGYLESSEELLKSIEEENSHLRAQRRVDLLDTLLTPLGIGSMLLLLLSSATLGYVIMNPSSLSAFLSPTSSGSPSNDANSPLTRVPTTPIDVAPPSPDLAAREFKELNLDSLSTLPGAERDRLPLQNPFLKRRASRPEVSPVQARKLLRRIRHPKASMPNQPSYSSLSCQRSRFRLSHL
ncbi:MAG: hypothetical protein HC772_12195, partial [Leptolyngbyaceae cyanobacterium CRU_2_3]|nr:hypothetical protein [Leptolyngbyaceae cyanobacterium CRU_2_3]